VSVSPSTIWFNPAVGVAGDMVMASLFALGADEDAVRAQLAALPVDGWNLEVTSTTRRGLVATKVVVEHDDHQHHRPWSQIDRMLSLAELTPFVADGARRTFAALGRAEADVHGVDIDEVHFHEVGAIDAIVDIVGSWAALCSLGGGSVSIGSAPVGLGAGAVPMAHGTVPVPAPATLELLVGHPSTPVDVAAETATPTGVALLVTMADRWGPPPAGVVRGVGRGAGRRDPGSHPNVLTAVRLEDAGGAAPFPSVVIETNVDDVTPETLGHVIERALRAGADDAWVTPIVMKKSRPAHAVAVLCRTELAAAMRELLAAETGTLGFRQRASDKFELERHTATVEVDGHAVRVKVGPHGAKAEHDDVAAAAAATGRPLRRVAADAVAAWRPPPVEDLPASEVRREP